MAIKIITLLLMFGCVALLAYKFIPLFLRRYYQIQNIRMAEISKQLDRMFIFTERKRLFKLFTIVPLALGLFGFILLRHPIGLIAGLALGLISPPILIKNISSQRRNRFQGQLVDGLMLLSSSLRAGMSLNQSFEVLAEELPAPISDEFALVVKENQMGVSLEDCLAHLKQRMPVSDLDLISTAINIARETGGDLTEIFAQLVYTMREKRKLEDRVKALTVQGRLQGLIMGILPIAFGVFIYFTNPENFQILLEDKLGQALLMYAMVSEVIGIILIKRLSKVEV
ncbi:MAG: type II secretion system F family protein [Candidatus Omnitrophota bacterium]|jgi:tight adherence protein B